MALPRLILGGQDPKRGLSDEEGILRTHSWVLLQVRFTKEGHMIVSQDVGGFWLCGTVDWTWSQQLEKKFPPVGEFAILVCRYSGILLCDWSEDKVDCSRFGPFKKELACLKASCDWLIGPSSRSEGRRTSSLSWPPRRRNPKWQKRASLSAAHKKFLRRRGL